jgi:hypothetical protein
MARKPKDETATDDATVEAEVTKEPRIKHPVPDGFDTPSNFALYVRHNELWDGTAAQIYSFTKGAFSEHKTKINADGVTEFVFGDDGEPEMTTPNGFPAVIHTDERKIINREAAIEWLKDYSLRRASARQIAAQRAEQRNQSVVLSVGRYTLTANRLVETRRAVGELATIAD